MRTRWSGPSLLPSTTSFLSTLQRILVVQECPKAAFSYQLSISWEHDFECSKHGSIFSLYGVGLDQEGHYFLLFLHTHYSCAATKTRAMMVSIWIFGYHEYYTDMQGLFFGEPGDCNALGFSLLPPTTSVLYLSGIHILQECTTTAFNYQLCIPFKSHSTGILGFRSCCGKGSVSAPIWTLTW